MWKRLYLAAVPVVLACGLAAWLSGCGSRRPEADPDEGEPAAPAVVALKPAPRHSAKARAKRRTRPPAESRKAAQRPVRVKKAPPPTVGLKPAVVEERPPAPPDRATRMVGELLRPSEAAFAPKSGRSPALSGPRALEQPDVPPPPFTGDVVRLPTAAGTKPLRPRHLADEEPLVRVRSDYRLPGPVEFPAVVLAREPAPDVEKSPPLPILARPQPDRAATDDPTAEASLAAALAGEAPVRTNPAPFDRPAIPDPFENHQVIRLRAAPPEAPPPPQVLPRTPDKSLPATGK